MKTVRSKKMIEMVAELAEIVEQRRELAKKEKQLKAQLDVALENEEAMKAGQWLVTATEKTRSSLDRKALEAEYGADEITRFEKVTTYRQIDLKKVA